MIRGFFHKFNRSFKNLKKCDFSCQTLIPDLKKENPVFGILFNKHLKNLKLYSIEFLRTEVTSDLSN